VITVQERAQALLNNLLGLDVQKIFQVGDMTCFVFSRHATDEQPSEWALHVLRGWRLEYRGRTVVGTYDQFEYGEPMTLPSEDWDPSKGGSYLDRVLRDLLGDRLTPDEAARDIHNRATGFVVTAVEVLLNGDCSILFANEYGIRILPLAGRGEAWVVFQHGKSEEGFSMYMEDLLDQ
jgi:hypothetical protein